MSLDLMKAWTSLRASSNCFFSTLSDPLKLPMVRLAQVAQPSDARYESRSHVRQPPMLIIIIEKANASTCVSGSFLTLPTSCRHSSPRKSSNKGITRLGNRISLSGYMVDLRPNKMQTVNADDDN